jgi:putative ABC transport system permease protein
MYKQMKFITTKDLGYDQHQIVSIPMQQQSSRQSEAFLENFRSAVSPDPSIVSITGASTAFAQGTMTIGFQHDGEMKVASGYIVDKNFISTFGIQILIGRDFDVGIPSDRRDAVIVNEAMVESLNWTNALNESLNLGLGEQSRDWKVIGVVKDFNFLSLEHDIGPLFLTMDTTFSHCQTMLVKISHVDIPPTMTRLERVFKRLSPDKPFIYSFVDENVEFQYRSYKRWMSIVGLATIFAIIISCLGLFGLAGINVSNRTKEIGIRKVLGAELSNIFVLLNKQFILLSLLAFVLAAYPAWYAMDQWLNSFKFRIEINLAILLCSFSAGLFFAIIAVSYHTLTAIRVSPIDSLKTE